MNGFFLFLLLVPFSVFSQDFNSLKGNTTPDYHEIIRFYDLLDRQYSTASLQTAGWSDAGAPIPLFIISTDQTFSAEEAKRKGKTVLLVNNGIHAGEPCGINASILYAKEMLEKGTDPNLVILIIPVFNIGGSFNRGCCSRANQNGPIEYGFRGNGRLLDLNRDFIKMDSRNAFSFVSVFRNWDPHVFVDTHSTNGADYQYEMTLITTQADKLGGSQGEFLRRDFEPLLFRKLKEAGVNTVPYVNVFHTIPDSGFSAFLETPRYATGYTALFQCLGFVTEAHMLKSFPVRVNATHQFLKVLTDLVAEKKAIIVAQRNKAREELATADSLPLNWVSDNSDVTLLPFNGFKAVKRKSEITGTEVLFYDQNIPYTRETKFYHRYKPEKIVSVPTFYVVPGAWREVVERLLANQVQMRALSRDTVMKLEVSYISSTETVNNPYEGHYLHYSTKTEKQVVEMEVRKGDYIVPTGQPARRFLVETLEADAPDSYFNWNFYDEIMQQKEWYSSYVFDTTAARLVDSDHRLKEMVSEWKKANPKEAKDPAKVLYFIYRNSPYFEKTYRRYPVFRGGA